MNFYDNLKIICDEKGIKVTPTVLSCGGTKGVLSGWKRGVMPNSEIVMNLAVLLKVPTDRLLFGKEKNSSEAHVLTEDKVRLIEMYDMLTDMEKGEILGELKYMVKEKQLQHPEVRTAKIAARSTNNTPPRIETGDFNDILNAPDSTDDYK